MSSYDRAFDKALDEWIKDRRQTLLEDAGHGLAQEPYWRNVGQVQALDDVKAAIEDIRKKLGAND